MWTAGPDPAVDDRGGALAPHLHHGAPPPSAHQADPPGWWASARAGLMERRVTVRVDDLDQTSPSAHRAYLALDGQVVQLDLTEQHHAELVGILGVYFTAGKTSSIPTNTFEALFIDSVEVRRWAAGQSIRVNARGRLPRIVVERYLADQAGAAVLSMTDGGAG